MLKRFLVIVLALALTIANANASDKVYTVNVAAVSVSGDQVRGPIKVKLVGINVIKQNVQVGVNVTYPAGPDLTLPFIPPIPKSTPQTTTPPTQTGSASTAGASATLGQAQAHGLIARNTLPQSPDVGLTFNALVNNLNTYEQTRYTLQSAIQDVIDQINSATQEVTSFVGSSDSALAANPTGTTLLARIPTILNGTLQAALAARWPNSGIANLEGDLAVLKNSLAVLPDNTGWVAWAAVPSNKTSHDGAVTRVNDLIGLVTSLESSTSKSASTMTDSQSKLQQWNAILSAVATGKEDSFSRTVDVTCSFGFSNNKNSQIEMTTTDRLAAAGTAAAKIEIVTVICSSPLSIGAGFGFSTVHEHQLSFVQSLNASNQVGSVFGFSARSNFTPVPVLLLNTRVHEWNDNWALHVSNGAVAVIQTGVTAGTAIQYVSGVSVSYKRSLFVTGGFQAGRVQHLAGGFVIGQPVPPGISTPPVENRWSPGFVLTFTYKLK
jgi:hypothetical protein